MKVTLTECTENPVLSIERAAANCYNSTPDDNGRIMNACYRSGHHSVLEFADFTFHIEGVSRSLTHQLVRHRCASYAQRSQRYCDEDGFDYETPNSILGCTVRQLVYEEAISAITNAYKKLQELGVPNEDARYILPNACHTEIEVKMNGRELIHFMNERLCSRAQKEIRELAKAMKKCVAEYNEQCAQFAQFLVPKCQASLDYPICTERNSCGYAPKLSDVYKAYQYAISHHTEGGEWYE